jgi:ABC-type lipoprotein release transport system permease subunit
MSLSLLGGLLGCVLALPLNGIQTRIGNFVTFSETAFEFQITPESIMAAMAFAAVMGVLGGILPAARGRRGAAACAGRSRPDGELLAQLCVQMAGTAAR